MVRVQPVSMDRMGQGPASRPRDLMHAQVGSPGRTAVMRTGSSYPSLRHVSSAASAVKLTPARILAIVLLFKDRLDLLLTPYLISRSARSLQKSSISIGKVHVYRCLAFVDASIIAIAKYRARHSAEDGLDYSHSLIEPRTRRMERPGRPKPS